MSLNNEVSSTSTLGFRVDGSRIGKEIVPLDVSKKTLAVLSGLIVRTNASPAILRKITAKILELRDDLEKSHFFMR